VYAHQAVGTDENPLRLALSPEVLTEDQTVPVYCPVEGTRYILLSSIIVKLECSPGASKNNKLVGCYRKNCDITKGRKQMGPVGRPREACSVYLGQEFAKVIETGEILLQHLRLKGSPVSPRFLLNVYPSDIFIVE